jgi:hypothetical protein
MSRNILGIEYTVFIMLLVSSLLSRHRSSQHPYADPTFAEKIAQLKDFHFELNNSALGPDSADLLN